LALALAGDKAEAVRLSKRMASQAASDASLRNIRLPELLAAIELKRGNPPRAIELLAAVKRYEEGWTDRYWAAYFAARPTSPAVRHKTQLSNFRKSSTIEASF